MDNTQQLQEQDKNKHDPKYKHLRGEIEYIFNEDVLLENKVPVIVEGIPDVIAMVQNGYSSVALLGTNLKSEDVRKFAKHESVMLMFDGDDAGRKAILKIGKMLGSKTKVCLLPEGKDPDEMTKEEIDKIISEAQDFYSYQIQLIDKITNKKEIPKLLEPILRQISIFDEVLWEVYLDEIKIYFGLSGEEKAAYRKLLAKYKKEAEEKQKKQQQKADISDGTDASGVLQGVYIANFPGLVDIVSSNGEPAFLVKQNTNLSINPSFSLKDTMYIPPVQEQIPWLLPRGEEVIRIYNETFTASKESDVILYDRLFEYHKSISELPSESYYDLLVLWDIHTYLQEQVQYTPLICPFAVPERGKSRTSKGMIYVAYRGLHVESLRDAFIVRMAENFHSSILFDVMDIWKKAEQNGSEDILLNRFEKGAKVPRVLYPEKGPFQDMVYYSIFGPTIIATNVPINTILDTRAIQINMPETTRHFENNVTPELALPLKEQLVAFRARHLEEELPEISKPTPSRLGDISKPLLQIIRLIRPEKEATFLELIKEIGKGRLIEKSETLEAQVLRILHNLKNNIEKGILANKLITDTLNIDKNEKYKYSYTRIGKLLSSLGFEKAKTSEGASAIIWNEQLLSLASQKYGVEYPSDASEPSGASDDALSDLFDISVNKEQKPLLPNKNRDEIFTIVKALRDAGDKNSFGLLPTKTISEYEDDEIPVYLEAAYGLLNNNKAENIDKYQVISRILEDEAKQRGISITHLQKPLANNFQPEEKILSESPGGSRGSGNL